MKIRIYIFSMICAMPMSIHAAEEKVVPLTPAPVLHASFFYKNEVGKAGTLAEHCEPPSKPSGPHLWADFNWADVAVSLTGKITESLIDTTAARTQPEATTLDVVIPLDHFYDGNGAIAVDSGCLVFHNGTDAKGSNATLKAVLQIKTSSDRSAFRFSVVDWEFSRFLKQQNTQWFQEKKRRDIALKIEFLTPGSASLGTRTAFIEHVFTDVDAAALRTLFIKEQALPWFAAPSRPDNKDDVYRGLPLNVRITVVETTRPNQFALWMHALALENKEAVSKLAQDSARKALDPVYGATEAAKLAEAAGTAYGNYKSAWDDLKAHHDARPDAADIAAMQVWKAGFTTKQQIVISKQVLARGAFDIARLSWPGNLPDLALN